MATNLSNIPRSYCQNLQRAIEILQNAGCSDVFLFGSLAHGNIHEGTDIDLAVRGCPTGQYFVILGKLFLELDYPVDLVNLDKPDVFAKFLEEQGELVCKLLEKTVAKIRLELDLLDELFAAYAADLLTRVQTGTI